MGGLVHGRARCGEPCWGSTERGAWGSERQVGVRGSKGLERFLSIPASLVYFRPVLPFVTGT